MRVAPSVSHPFIRSVVSGLVRLPFLPLPVISHHGDPTPSPHTLEVSASHRASRVILFGYLWQSRKAESERFLLILPLSSSCAHTGGERSLSVFFYQLPLTRANGIEGAPCLQFPPLEPHEPRPDSPTARTHQGSKLLGAGAFHAPSHLESSHWSDQRWAAQRSSALTGQTRLLGEGRKAPGIPAQCGKQQKTYPREFLPQYLRIVWPSSRLVLVVLPTAQGTLPPGHLR